MPVRSLTSSVLKWPDREEVERALRRWVERGVATRPELLRVGYLGSYARGDWGVGSDLDVIVVVTAAGEPFSRRAASWDTTELPVPVDLLVYTKDEWERMKGRLATTIQREAIWVYER